MATTDTVPTIDISGPFSCDLAERTSVAHAIGRASEDVGFLTITGHGIHPGLVREAFGRTRRVFARPTGEKMSYAWNETHPNRGYDPPASQRLDSKAAPYASSTIPHARTAPATGTSVPAPIRTGAR